MSGIGYTALFIRVPQKNIIYTFFSFSALSNETYLNTGVDPFLFRPTAKQNCILGISSFKLYPFLSNKIASINLLLDNSVVPLNLKNVQSVTYNGVCFSTYNNIYPSKWILNCHIYNGTLCSVCFIGFVVNGHCTEVTGCSQLVVNSDRTTICTSCISPFALINDSCMCINNTKINNNCVNI